MLLRWFLRVGSAGFAEVVEGAGCAEVVVSLLLVGSGSGALDVVVGAGVCSVVVTAGVLMTSVLTVIASALSHQRAVVPTASAVIRERAFL